MYVTSVASTQYEPPPILGTLFIPVGQTQRLPEHDRLRQSVPCLHVLPVTHFGQSTPPQSRSLSVPLMMLSVHVAGSQVCVPASQWLETQSAALRHARLSVHGVQTPPPQSTSVSAAFFAPSMHVGAHFLFVQRLPLQSVSKAQ